MNQVTLQLAKAQEVLRAIDKLSNIQQKVTAAEAKEVAYLIHRTIEAGEVNSTIANELLHWSIAGNRELFMSA